MQTEKDAVHWKVVINMKDRFIYSSKQLESVFFSVEKRYSLFRERKVVWQGGKWFSYSCIEDLGGVVGDAQ